MSCGHGSNFSPCTTKKQPVDGQGPSTSTLPTSITLEGSNSKSPLKVPQGLIVRTPSGRDCQGCKTPPRFFAVTNEQLQRMHSSASSEEKKPFGPKHFRFKDENQTTDEGSKCFCTNSVGKTEMAKPLNQKDIKGSKEKTGGMITLKSLLEAEIRRSNTTQTPKEQKEDTKLKHLKITQLSSPSASLRPTDSPHMVSCTQKQRESATDETAGESGRLTIVNHDARAVTVTASPLENNASTSMLSTTKLFNHTDLPNPLKAIDSSSSECNTDGSSLGLTSECRLAIPDNEVPKGSLLDMLLSSTEPLVKHRIGAPSLKEGEKDRSKRTNADIHDPLDRTPTKLPGSPPSKGMVTSKFTTNSTKERENMNSQREIFDEERFPQAAESKSCHISRSPKESHSGLTRTSVPEVHTEQLPTVKNGDVGSAVVLNKAESNLTLDISQRPSCSHLEAEPGETSRNSKTPEIPVSSLKTMDVSLLTQSKNPDVFHGFSASSSKVPDDSAGVPDPIGSVKRMDKTIAFDHCPKPSKTSENLNDDSTPRHEQKAKLPPKTTLIITPVMTSSANAVPRCSGPSGQLLGLVHSSNNANGPVVLVALGSRPQSSNGSTTLTGTGSNVRGAKPQSSSPVMINNMALTGNTNTDAFNVWKSYVSQAYRDKYGDNYEYYMHNRWVSMSVAEKSPFVHQVSNRLSPSVVVQTPSNNSLTSNQDTIVIKAPTTKNAKPSIQRQINVIPRLQTTGPDRIIADNPVSARERDVLGELYRSTNMADISSDFPIASSNGTLRKVTKGSSDFLTDPGASFDPLFAQCLLSGRPYDIENWMAMKKNWRETPEWIVDFLADCDERKRARRATIDAAVMRRVAMVQRMTGEQDDDDDAETYTVQTPQKHTGKKYPQFGDSKENTPTCQKKTHQSESTEGSIPHEDASYSKKDNKCLTPTKVKTATCTQTKGPELINGMLHDQITTGQGKTSGSNEFQRSSFLKPESKPMIIATTIPNAEHKTVSPNMSSSTREDEGSSNALPTQNTENSSFVNQEYRVHSQDINDLGNLDLITDEELWNIQCSLFPPWQRVQSFIDADAAENFFKNLDKDSIRGCVPHPPDFFSYTEQVENVAEEETAGKKNHLQHSPVDEYAKSFGHEYGAQQDKYCGNALPSTSSLIKETNVTDNNVSIIPSPISHFGNDKRKLCDTPRVRRCLFSGISFKNECQSESYESTEPMKSSPTHVSKTFAINQDQDGLEESDKCVASSVNHHDKIVIQVGDLISREAEEDAAVSKLLEILEEQGSSERLDTKEMATNQNNVLTKGRSTSEKMNTAASSVIPERACEMQGTTVRRPQLASEIDEWHEEVKPIAATDSSSSPCCLLREVVVPSPVKKPWNEMTRAEDNNHSSGEKNGSPFKKETQRDPVLETTHNLLVDHGNSVSHITRKTEEEEKKSRKIERWHEEIQPIVALAVNSSSSSCSVENEVRTTHYEDEPRTTPTVELQVYMKGVQASKNRKDDQKADITENPKVIPTATSSSGEYLTADDTDLHSGGFGNRGTPEPCIIIKKEHSDELLQRTLESSSPKVFADGTTMSGQCGDGDILDGEIDKGASSAEERINGSARKNHGRMRKKRRQESHLDDRLENTPQTSFSVALSSSDASVTSVASSSSSSCITTSRKGRGKKRRRKKKRHSNRSEWNVARDASSPSESHTSREAKDQSPLHQDVDRDDSESDIPTTTCIEKSSTKLNLHPDTNKSQQDRSSKAQSGCVDDAGEDGSGDDSSDEFVIEDQSPTSPLKIVMRRSSRLKIRRVSKLPRLRSRRYSSVAMPVKSSRKFTKKTIQRRKDRVK